MIISVYSSSPNSGKRSMASAMAYTSALAGNETLLVELDYARPSLAHYLKVSDPYKNALKYFERGFTQRSFSADGFIVKSKELQHENKEFQKAFREFPESLHFLSFPEDYQASMFPNFPNENNREETARFMIEEFYENIKLLNYHVVILVLPSSLSDMFGLPMMLKSDCIVNMVAPNLQHFKENKDNFPIYNSVVQSDWINVLNMKPKTVDLSDYHGLFAPLKIHFSIPYEEEKPFQDLNINLGSPALNKTAVELLKALEINAEEEPRKKKGLFART